jgi:pyridoxine kinase
MATSGSPSGARVLSIQSHVVHGHVGNKSAVFPMQLLNIEVDFINSVQFSNHTGYKQWRGTVMTGEQLWELVEGLEMNELAGSYTHLLTGHPQSIPCPSLDGASPSILNCIQKWKF